MRGYIDALIMTSVSIFVYGLIFIYLRPLFYLIMGFSAIFAFLLMRKKGNKYGN